jgi:predicted phosphoribosyltransferase
MRKYLNRREAGVVLAEVLRDYRGKKNVIVLALPRGGVPVAYEVATTLQAPLDVYIVRKLGVPGHHELAMGAIAQGGATIFNQEIINMCGITQKEIEAVIESESAELMRREIAYRGKRSFPSLSGKIVILVDDGIATGATMKAAILSIRRQNPLQIMAAVPVADQRVKAIIEPLVDVFVCPLVVANLEAVGLWYDDFSQTEDTEVIGLLGKAAKAIN